jgi:tRNA G10  N-methylase Trm11
VFLAILCYNYPMYLFILGRQPELSLAELESIFGAENIRQIAPTAAILRTDFPAGFRPESLGGVIKIARVVGQSWGDIAELLPQEGKVTLGLSSDKLAPRELQKIGLGIKRQRGSTRLVPNQTAQLSSATVLNNKLHKGRNRFEFIKIGEYLAQTFFVQDINNYTVRDRGRPRRDARVGMLPPKLAQIMINLAMGGRTDDGDCTLLDPFCGTGVILQEALFRPGLTAYGSDLNERMVEYTRENLAWAFERFRLTGDAEDRARVELGDATDYQWREPVDFVVSEAYLGQPYASPPSPEKLQENVATCNQIIKKFLQNLHGQIGPDAGICVAVPVWFVNKKVTHLPLLQDLQKLGFQAKYHNLIYHREDQIVGRELLVLRKI